jgi:hypothetical protein
VKGDDFYRYLPYGLGAKWESFAENIKILKGYNRENEKSITTSRMNKLLFATAGDY